MNKQDNLFYKMGRQFIKLSSWEYFEPALAIFVVIFSFILGRKLYESKFCQILNIINDSQNQKRRLKQLFQQQNESLRGIKARLLYFKIFTFGVIIANGIYVYLNNFKFNTNLLIWSGVGIATLWIIILIRIQYLDVMIKRTDTRLQRKTMSSQSDARQVMNLLGEPLCNALKNKFESDFQVQMKQEQIKQCDLKKCHDQKKTYKQLYQLYKSIIAQMQNMIWCDICSQSLNVEANQLKFNQIEARIKTYKAAPNNMSLEKKKQLANRLLQQWQMIQAKLPNICKRGCCIKFRVVLEEIKKRHHSELGNLKAKLK